MQQHLTNFENLSPGDPILNPALFEKIMRPYSDARAKKFRGSFFNIPSFTINLFLAP